jgi:hypothetical protein
MNHGHGLHMKENLNSNSRPLTVHLHLNSGIDHVAIFEKTAHVRTSSSNLGNRDKIGHYDIAATSLPLSPGLYKT